jgi:hypothetical protein
MVLYKLDIRQIIDLIPSHLIQQHRSDKGSHIYRTCDQLIAPLKSLNISPDTFQQIRKPKLGNIELITMNVTAQ